MLVLCLHYAYYSCTMLTMPVLCLLCLYYTYYACTMPIYYHPSICRVFKSLGHILTLNISKTIEDITNIMYSESFYSKFFMKCLKMLILSTGLPGFFCSRIPNFQQLDAKIKCEIPNFLWFLLAIRNKLSLSVNLLYP